MGGRRAGNLEAELMWRWRLWWRQWWRKHQNQEFSVHKWVDLVYKCQKYNQRELQRLATGSYRISPHLWHGFQHSCHRNFLTHHGPSARHCRLKLLQRQMTAIPCIRLRWPVFLIRSLHARSSIARRQVSFVFRVSFAFRWRRRYLLASCNLKIWMFRLN